jgi:hypothetical protein
VLFVIVVDGLSHAGKVVPLRRDYVIVNVAKQPAVRVRVYLLCCCPCCCRLRLALAIHALSRLQPNNRNKQQTTTTTTPQNNNNRSFDQFSNIVLENAHERKVVGTKYADIPFGMFLVRGESIVLMGDLVHTRTHTHTAFCCSFVQFEST